MIMKIYFKIFPSKCLKNSKHNSYTQLVKANQVQKLIMLDN